MISDQPMVEFVSFRQIHKILLPFCRTCEHVILTLMKSNDTNDPIWSNTIHDFCDLSTMRKYIFGVPNRDLGKSQMFFLSGNTYCFMV